MRPEHPVAIITGASAGIGEATARALAGQGYHLALGARRVDRLEKLAASLKAEFKIEVIALPLDVTQEASAAAFVEATVRHFGDVHVLVNNAGKALGRQKLAETPEVDVREMLATNVEGVARMTRLATPSLKKAGWGHIVLLGSIAGHDTYVGGSVYCATKHAVAVFQKALRMELLGQPIRVSSIDPGMVETEFSVVRLGSQQASDELYANMDPLRATDIAECIRWVLSLPDHVNIDEIIVQPRDQANVTQIHRHS